MVFKMPYDAIAALIVAISFVLIYLFDKKFGSSGDNEYTAFGDVFLFFAVIFFWIALVTYPTVAYTTAVCNPLNITTGVCTFTRTTYNYTTIASSSITNDLSNSLFDTYTFVCIVIEIMIFIQMLIHFFSNSMDKVSDA